VIGLAGAVAFGAAQPQSATEIIAEADVPDVPARVFARSLNGARSWQPARPILDTGAGLLTTGHQLAVPRRLLDIFTLIDLRQDPQRPTLPVAVMRSTDRGASWSPPAVVADTGVGGHHRPRTGDPLTGGTRPPSTCARHRLLCLCAPFWLICWHCPGRLGLGLRWPSAVFPLKGLGCDGGR